MHQFVDNTGQAWPISVTWQDILDVRTDCAFDLGALFDGEQKLVELHTKFDLLVAVTHRLLKSRLEEAGFGPADFARRMGGDALASAAEAIVQATIDFFPDPQRREGLREVVAKLSDVGNQVVAAKLKAALAELDTAAAQLLGSDSPANSMKLSTPAPDSLASTPDPSLSLS